VGPSKRKAKHNLGTAGGGKMWEKMKGKRKKMRKKPVGRLGPVYNVATVEKGRGDGNQANWPKRSETKEKSLLRRRSAWGRGIVGWGGFFAHDEKERKGLSRWDWSPRVRSFGHVKEGTK